jgi:hypothetical protein
MCEYTGLSRKIINEVQTTPERQVQFCIISYIFREGIKRAPQERASAAPLFHLSCTVTGGAALKG